MIYLRSYFFIALFLVVFPSVIMPGEMSEYSSSSSSSSEDGTRLLFDNARDKMYYALQNAGNKAEPGSLEVNIDSAWFTDHAFWKGVIPNLAEKGAKIDVTCSPSGYNNQAIEYLEKVSEDYPYLHIHQQPQHGKRVLIKYVDNETGESKSQVFEGSHNLSHAARTKNLEVMSYTKNDAPYFKQVKESHDSQYDSPDEDKENKPSKLVTTPQKKKHIDSNSYDLMDSVVRRIQNAEKNDELYLTSMNFSHPKVINAIEKACDRGVKTDIFVNNTALNSKTSGDFEKLKDAGANIYVYPEDKEGIFHMKLCLRVNEPNTKHEDPVLIVQSRNFSEDTNNPELNHQAIFPHDHNLSDQVKEHLKSLKKQKIFKPLTDKMIQNALLKKEEKNSKSSKKSSLKKKKILDNSLNSPIHKNKTRKRSNNIIPRVLFKNIEKEEFEKELENLK